MTRNRITQVKFLLKGSILKSAGALLLLISFEATAQKRSESLTASLSADIKKQILLNLHASHTKPAHRSNSLDIFSSEWFGHFLPVRTWRLEKTNTIHVASEKLPTGDRSLFYTVEGNRKFIRFSKK